MKPLGIIPARYDSTRFPGKPLVEIRGKPMIQRVYEQAAKALAHIYVATDNQEIKSTVEAFGGKAIMTSPMHESGTERCSEALEKIAQTTHEAFDVVVNIQGDEPMLKPEQIHEILSGFKDAEAPITTLIKRIESDEILNSPHAPKVVIDARDMAMYFSREAIPYFSGLPRKKWRESYPYYAHIGMYAYKTSMLRHIVTLPPGNLEKAEKLEQLRWLENGINIRTVETHYENYSVDTPEDLQQILPYFDA